MMSLPAERFAPVVQSLELAELTGFSLTERLLIDRRGELSVYYAPFDHVNEVARIVLVGITPGHQQMQNALLEERRLLEPGASIPVALAGAKKVGSFSGPMRRNLCEMLDFLRVNELLGIERCSSLFDVKSDLVHFTSLLRYPVFRSGCNYNGSPDMLRNDFLRGFLYEYFVREADVLSKALFVPLGPKVSEVLDALAERGLIPRDHVLTGLEHPSGANSERIAYFLGRKPREELSAKTDPVRIDRGRTSLRDKIARLRATDAGPNQHKT